AAGTAILRADIDLRSCPRAFTLRLCAFARDLLQHASKSKSNVKQEVTNVTVLHHVVLPFDAHLARFADRLLAFVLFEVGDRVRFAADEAPLEIRMDDAGRLRGGGADGDR